MDLRTSIAPDPELMVCRELELSSAVNSFYNNVLWTDRTLFMMHFVLVCIILAALCFTGLHYGLQMWAYCSQTDDGHHVRLPHPSFTHALRNSHPSLQVVCISYLCSFCIFTPLKYVSHALKGQIATVRVAQMCMWIISMYVYHLYIIICNIALSISQLITSGHGVRRAVVCLEETLAVAAVCWGK